ncbi:MAG TPA: hypothetical protein VFQ80_14415 [Thermomicrobiales bacterium]|nr:hypothetical protein [Thermomicrobiales bacterium]
MRGDDFDRLTRRGALGLLLGLTTGLVGRQAAAGCATDGDCTPCSVCVNQACIPLDPICGPKAPPGSPGCDACHDCDDCGHCVPRPTTHPCVPDACTVDRDCGSCRACVDGHCVTIDPMCLPNAPIGTPPCGRCERCNACGVCVPAKRRCRHRAARRSRA